jgi:hypothetical protein
LGVGGSLNSTLLARPQTPTGPRDRRSTGLELPLGAKSRLSQTLEALRLESGAYRLLGTWKRNAAVRVEPFDAIALDLSALWTA